MEDNDKRNSSVPSAESGDSKPDMFDQHEATLPRFTIDPGDARDLPQRQRTRTLLGVPSLVAEEPEPRLPTPPTPGVADTTQASGRLSPAAAHADTFPAAPSADVEARNNFDVTIDVVDDELNDVTMVSDADVVALPDNTGQVQPVRFDEPVAPAVAAVSARDVTATEPAVIAAPTNPNSLSPREISKPDARARNNEAASGRFGALLVAAVMLLATGAWFMTAGTFRRATLSSAESTTAAATQPAAEKTEKAQAPAEAPKAAEVAATAPATPAPATPAPATPAPATTAQAPSSDDTAAPGAGLKNKPALTAAVRGERVRRSSKAKAAAPAPTGDLPQGPTRSEVVTRLESVRPAVQACAAGRSGVADLDVTIAHTGVVMHVLVGGDFAGTTEGSCIARAVRGARFPAFKQERFRLLYPYAI